MLMSQSDLIPPERLRVMQIIAATLPAGVIAMAAVLLFIVYSQATAGPIAQQQIPIVSLVAAVFFAVAGVMSFVVPGFLTQANLRQIAARTGDGDVIDLLNLRQTTLIVGMALLEGASFFGLIAFLVERQPLALIIPGLGLLAMFARFPTANSVREWMETNGRRVLELRQDRV